MSHSVLNELMAIYPEEVRLVVRHRPWDANDITSLAAQAAEAAGAQGRFWEMTDMLFERQGEWRDMEDPDEFIQALVSYAQEIGVPDVARFEADLRNGTYFTAMEEAINEAVAEGINSTPTMFINGTVWEGYIDTTYLSGAVESVLLASNYPQGPPMVIDEETTYYATLVTEHGDVVVELFTALAPQTVNNFIYLACTGYYDNNTFYRVLPNFAAQTGDPTNTGMGRPGYTILDEYENGLLFDRAGLLSMAMAGYPDSAGGQIFITYGPQEHLNGRFTVFGEVVEGMDALDALQPRDPQTDPNAPPGDLLETVTIQEAG